MSKEHKWKRLKKSYVIYGIPSRETIRELLKKTYSSGENEMVYSKGWKKEKNTVADEELKALEALERREGKSKLDNN